jgi:hypothetical protein
MLNVNPRAESVVATVSQPVGVSVSNGPPLSTSVIGTLWTPSRLTTRRHAGHEGWRRSHAHDE